jgi:hypothetical protein
MLIATNDRFGSFASFLIASGLPFTKNWHLIIVAILLFAGSEVPSTTFMIRNQPKYPNFTTFSTVRLATDKETQQ